MTVIGILPEGFQLPIDFSASTRTDVYFALLATSSMAAVLHGVRPADPLTFASVPLVQFTTALAGSMVPALRATRVDPVTTLRSE